MEKGHGANNMTGEPEEKPALPGTEQRKAIRYCCKLRAVRSGTDTVAFKPSRLARVVPTARST
jgi:hypothetical protein